MPTSIKKTNTKTNDNVFKVEISFGSAPEQTITNSLKMQIVESVTNTFFQFVTNKNTELHVTFVVKSPNDKK